MRPARPRVTAQTKDTMSMASKWRRRSDRPSQNADLYFAQTHSPHGFTHPALSHFDGDAEPVVRELLQNSVDAADKFSRMPQFWPMPCGEAKRNGRPNYAARGFYTASTLPVPTSSKSWIGVQTMSTGTTRSYFPQWCRKGRCLRRTKLRTPHWHRAKR